MGKFTTWLLAFIALSCMSCGGIHKNLAVGKCTNNESTNPKYNFPEIYGKSEMTDCRNNNNNEYKHKTKRMVSTNALETYQKQTFGRNEIQIDDIDELKLNPTAPYLEYFNPFETSKRMGKSLESDNVDEDKPTKTLTTTLEPPTTTYKNESNLVQGRQNPNPDIQDIISGIVKLLNGNVNVHANTQQPVRRPTPVRINNRGPPRISEAQPILPEFNEHFPNKPFPFDRPGSPIRPFFNGIVEQTVPSVQQNYRPNFVSQNRPPWQRPRPLPPLENKQQQQQRPMNPAKKEPMIYEQHLPNQIQMSQYNKIESTSTAQQKHEANQQIKENETTQKPADATKISPTKIYSTTTSTSQVMSSKNENLNEIDVKPFSTTQSMATISSDSKILQISSSTLESSMADIVPTTTLSNTITPTLPLESAFNKTMTKLTSNSLIPSQSRTKTAQQTIPTKTSVQFTTRHGIVLDDTDFSRQHHKTLMNIKPTTSIAYQGYGEIFDVTLSAVQGLSDAGQTQNINLNQYDKPFDTNVDEFVSIDGKKSYINLFDSNERSSVETPSKTKPTIQPTKTISSIKGTGYAIVEKETIPTNYPKPHYSKPKQPVEQNSPPIRIDTCIVGDDSTCDLAQNEKCKIENSVSSCHCKPGYARKRDRDPCRKIVSILMSLRVDKIYDRKIVYDAALANKKSDLYRQLSYESIRAIDSAMSMTPFSDEFLDAYVNNIYNGDPAQGFAGVFVNLTLQLEENNETLRPSVKSDLQKHLLGVINRRNNNIGKSALFVESSLGSISNLQDLDECTTPELNDCHANAICHNIWGSFRCQCDEGLRDPWSDHAQRSGRECLSCADEFCNNRGTCQFKENTQICTCDGSYYGAQCEIDGEVLGVAIGASVAAIIIILLTLVCLILWSRKWQREQKDALEGPMFGYMSGTQIKSPRICQTPYQLTLEERMRWAHVADVMAQSNHYDVNPSAPTILNYPNLQIDPTTGTLSLADSRIPTATLQPRYGYDYSSSGKNFESSSVSEEETSRADLLDRNFQVPRPRSRTNASINSQSGIYYDVDIDSSEANLYDVTQPSTGLQKHFIPMSTYSAGRGNSMYYKN